MKIQKDFCMKHIERACKALIQTEDIDRKIELLTLIAGYHDYRLYMFRHQKTKETGESA